MFTMKASTLKARDLVVVALDNHKDKESKGQYLDVQLNAADIRPNTPEAGQANLHAFTRKREDGRQTNEAFYANSQFEAIKQAAGDKVQPVMSTKEPGKQIGMVYSVNADLTYGKSGGLAINTEKPMKAGPDIPADILKQQGAYMRQASEANKQAKAASRQLPDVEAQTEAPQAEAQAGE